jgi:type II secretory pathway pseudopilin PulG
MAGISFSVRYDQTKLSYVESAVQSDFEDLRSALVYNNAAKQQLNLSWTADAPVLLPASAKLFTFSFKVLDGAEAGATPLTVTVTQLYDSTVVGGQAQYPDIAIDNPNSAFTKNIVVLASDGQVGEVIKAIDAIGEVSYTSASLKKINDAAQKYALLNQSQKSAVTNYSTLLAAQIEYERLKALSAQTPVDNAVSAYLNKHSGALALTVDTVALTDEAAVNAAWVDFENLSPAAKYEIFYLNPRLKALLARLEVLKKDENDRLQAEEEERRLREEAEDLAKTFREDKAAVLILKDEDITADHYLVLNDALALLVMFSDMNPYVADLLEQERVLLTRQLNIAEAKYIEAGKEPEPGALEAARFKNAFAWILSQTGQSVTASDKMDIMLAIEVYKLQSDAAKKLLSGEYDLLSELLASAEKQEKENVDTAGNTDNNDPAPPPGDTGGDPDDGAPADSGQNNPEVVVVVKPGGGSVGLNFANRDIGIIVYILLLLLIPALLIFGSLQLYYHKYIKPRYSRDRKAGDA